MDNTARLYLSSLLPTNHCPLPTHEPPTVRNAAALVGAEDEPLAGAAVSQPHQPLAHVQPEDHEHRRAGDGARPPRDRRGPRHPRYAQPFVPLRFLRADRGGPSRGAAVPLPHGVASVPDEHVVRAMGAAGSRLLQHQPRGQRLAGVQASRGGAADERVSTGGVPRGRHLPPQRPREAVPRWRGRRCHVGRQEGAANDRRHPLRTQGVLRAGPHAGAWKSS